MRKLFLVITLAFISGLNAQKITSTQFEEIEETSKIEMYPETSTIEELSKDTYMNTGSSKDVKGGIAERLIKKANGYFDKMWYAEAARIYDIVLEENKQEHTFDLLSKAADAHYYSGNMEKSYKWFHELYQNHKKTITEESFFKYSHSLKAAGQFKRAAEITRFFRKKREKTLKVLAHKDALRDNSPYVEIKNIAINSKYSDFSPMLWRWTSGICFRNGFLFLDYEAIQVEQPTVFRPLCCQRN